MYSKFCHWLDMKINKSTSYKLSEEKDNFGLHNVLYHAYRRLIYPLKEKGWFGYCDWCGKFHKGLETAMVGADVDFDGEAMVNVPEWGKVCQKCLPELEPD
jgi:hypothetical protein